MKSIQDKFHKLSWRYAEGDEAALNEFEERIAEAGRNRSLVTYSELVRDVELHLPNLRQSPRIIDVTDWQELDRAIVGEFLGYISMRSYDLAGFFSSALV